MADVDAAPGQSAPAAEGEQAVEAEETEVEPAASPALAALYGKHSFPASSLAPEVPVSAVIAACWPEKDAQVRSWQLLPQPCEATFIGLQRVRRLRAPDSEPSLIWSQVTYRRRRARMSPTPAQQDRPTCCQPIFARAFNTLYLIFAVQELLKQSWMPQPAEDAEDAPTPAAFDPTSVEYTVRALIYCATLVSIAPRWWPAGIAP